MAITDRRGVSVSAVDTPIAGDPNPGLAIKAPCRVATTANITLSGLQTVDGVTLVAGDRVLVWQQTDQTTNGLYNVSSGPWTRTIDARSNDQWADGAIVEVNSGTQFQRNIFQCQAADPITLGTTLIAFVPGNPVPSSRRINTTAPLTGGGQLASDLALSLLTNGITYSLMQQASASRLLGNPTGAGANISEISLGATLAFSGSALQTTALTGDVTTLANSFATTIAANAVSNAKFRQSAGLSVVGVAGTATANVADITGAANGVLAVNAAGTSLGFVSVTYAMRQQVSASRLLGNPTGAGATEQEISLGATLAFSGTALQTTAFTGDITTPANSFATTLATVNANVGTFGSATQTAQLTVNGKGLVSAAANVTITPAVGSITGLGTGVATALGVNVGTAGAFVVNGGALGSPSSAGTMPAFTLGGTVTGGSQNITGLGTIASAAHTITSASANALAVGLNGATNPAFNVDASTASQVAGLNVKGAVTGGTVAVATTDSGSITNLSIDAKGTGIISIGTNSTGPVTVGAGGTTAGINGKIILNGSSGSNSGASIQFQRNATNLFQFGNSSGILGGTSDDFVIYSNVSGGGTNASIAVSSSTGNVTINNGIATPAGGSTSARLLFGTTAGFGIYYGSGAPTVSAAQGSVYLRSDGSSTSTRLYINTNGSTTWTNVTTAA